MQSTQLPIHFVLNGKEQQILVDSQMTVLQLLREQYNLLGTKEGCGEGDCGACTVSLGSIENGRMVFRAVASCICPVSKINGKHLITVEGLGNHSSLNIIQEMIINSHGIQCGFCSPGIIMSYFCLFAMNVKPTVQEMEIALQGNICRCTGYAGIRKAGEALIRYLENFSGPEQNSMIVPRFVNESLPILKRIQQSHGNGRYLTPLDATEYRDIITTYPQACIISGGTDVMPRLRSQENSNLIIVDVSHMEELKTIEYDEKFLNIGSQVSMSELASNPDVLRLLPIIREMAPLVASTQIRNQATIAGNIANASPIGDFTILLLALDAQLILCIPQGGERRIALRDFFQGYKKTALKTGELIAWICIPMVNDVDNKESIIHFEKSSRRKDVDIATVNSASCMHIVEGVIWNWDISFGGVGPVPMLFEDILEGNSLPIEASEGLVLELGEKIAQRGSLIDDVRGSADYRRKLMRNHVLKHFLVCSNRMDSEVKNG